MPRSTAVFALLALTPSLGHLRAQEIDTVLPSHPPSQFTILDQIADPAERSAFERLFQEHDAQKRRAGAQSFLNRFPASWLLAQAYEIASKASLELNEYDAALDFAAKSLQLWPENPLLLVPIAALQAKQQLYDRAVRSANEALWCLDRFGPPASIAERDWPRLESSLRAAAHFVLGRVAAARGLGSSGETSLAGAERELLEAARLDPSDPEIAYLLGLVESGLNHFDTAAAWYAAAWRLHGALESESLAQLRKLYVRLSPARTPDFDTFAASLSPPKLPANPQRSPATAPGEYSSTAVCLNCHPREHASWQHTGMARMFREYRPGNVSGAFSASAAMAPGTESIRPVLDKGAHYFEIRSSSGAWARYPVQYTIGSKWQQAYAAMFPGGDIQVFPVQYNLLRKEWVNYWKLTDPPGSERADIGKFPASVPGANYQFNCAPCHTSQLQYSAPGSPAAKAAMREGGINCEMCHGPSGRHPAEMKGPGPSHAKQPGDPPVDFKRIGAGEYVAICAQCHRQSSVRAPEAGGAVNFSQSGEKFYRVSLSRPFVDFSRKAFYKDGRFRVTTFIVESFERSACYRRGQAHCGSCHDPHPANANANPVSLKYREDSDAMCLSCHAAIGAKQQAHTRHLPSSAASRCVSCHMPRIMESVLFTARSHQIDDIPNAATASRFGQPESPNACLLCHRDRDVKWLDASLRAWRPSVYTPHQTLTGDTR